MTTTRAWRSGLLRADAGSITIHGIDAVADPIGNKQITACLLDELTIYERLTLGALRANLLART
jgi:ABC-2 type transport system ATP-binding protein